MSFRTTTLAGAALLLGLATAAAQDADHDAGRAVFTEAVPSCAVCHTLADAGAVGKVGPNLDDLQADEARVRAAVTSGVGVMPAFGDMLDTEEIAAVSRYVAAVAGKP